MITASQIKKFRNESIDYADTVLIKDELARLRRKRSPFYLTKEELDKILHWKLRGQYGRLNHLLSANSDELIQKVTGLALSVEHPDADYELELRFKILTCLRGVGVPVASAILALIYPETNAVIDFRGWRQIFGENKTGLFMMLTWQFGNMTEVYPKELT
jgi:hypothetical protein